MFRIFGKHLLFDNARVNLAEVADGTFSAFLPNLLDLVSRTGKQIWAYKSSRKMIIINFVVFLSGCLSPLLQFVKKVHAPSLLKWMLKRILLDISIILE